VVAADGGVYARAAIKSWIEECLRGACDTAIHRVPREGMHARPWSPLLNIENGGWDSAKRVHVICVSTESRQYVWILCCMWQRTVSSCLPRLVK
jgi:hypothetical protein